MAGLSKGAVGELLAARFLRKKGYDIVSANYRSRFGEIDLVATHRRYLVFVEVKTRAPDALYTGREAVTRAKQQRIIQTAKLYLARYPTTLQPRFDVIEVVIDPNDPQKAKEITQWENAFEAGGAMHGTV